MGRTIHLGATNPPTRVLGFLANPWCTTRSRSRGSTTYQDLWAASISFYPQRGDALAKRHSDCELV